MGGFYAPAGGAPPHLTDESKSGHYVATFGGARALKTIGVRQLKNEATQIVRAVREQHALYVITVNGQPVATLRPYSERDIAGMQRSEAASEIAAIERLADSVGEAWLTVPLVDDAGMEPDGSAARRRRYRLPEDE